MASDISHMLGMSVSPIEVHFFMLNEVITFTFHQSTFDETDKAAL